MPATTRWRLLARQVLTPRRADAAFWLVLAPSGSGAAAPQGALPDLIQRPVRVLGQPSAPAACGDNLNLP
jgi:hypothetical protein